MYKKLETKIREVFSGVDSGSTYTRLEHDIRNVMEANAKVKNGSAWNFEKDQNDQVPAGSYTTKNFEVSKDAQKFFLGQIPKESDPNAVEQMAIHTDKLFDMVKHAIVKERITKDELDIANDHVRKIHDLAGKLNLLDKVKPFIKDQMDTIEKYKAEENPINMVSADDVEKEVASRFASKPYDPGEVPRDFDVDNDARFINRRVKAERKLKIIDDEYKHQLEEAIEDSKKFSQDDISNLVGKLEKDPSHKTSLAIIIANAMVRNAETGNVKGLTLLVGALQLLQMSTGDDVLASVARRLLSSGLSSKNKKG